MKIFVTGGCGSIGSILTEKLLSEGHDVLYLMFSGLVIT